MAEISFFDESDDDDIEATETGEVDYESWVRFGEWISTMLLWLRARFQVTDSAMSFLLMLISVMLKVTVSPLATIFPSTIYLLTKRHGLPTDIESLASVVCPNNECNKLYKLTDLVADGTENALSCECSDVRYGSRCGSKLLGSKQLSRGRIKVVPKKVYLFQPPSQWLKELFQSAEFRNLLQKRFERNGDDNSQEDAWDGYMWQKYQRDPVDNSELLCLKNNIAFMFNVDWVKPYKRSEYKIGLMYLSILNLPRSQRMLKKWTLVLGVIPGPGEPKIHINTFLEPLVNDLMKLWAGIAIPIDETMIHCRALLLCISCDLPALRKTTQFLSHKAIKGCNKCEFSADREVNDSGEETGRMSYFSRNNQFVGRTVETVLLQSREYSSAVNKTQAKRIAKANGVRYCELHRLPYFDPINMCVEDPMHALLLGLVKKETEMLLEQDTSAQNYNLAVPLNQRKEFQRRLKSIHVPSDCGRIPIGLEEKRGLDGFTAQQWLLFALIYARPAFYGLIPQRAYDCLQVLCKMAEICAKHKINANDINNLATYTMDHHKRFCALYGKWKISINNHMMLHLPETLKNFGPCHVFWCFAFERMNGILTDVPSSGRAPEKELLKRFLAYQRLALQDSNMYDEIRNRFGRDVESLKKVFGQVSESEEEVEHYKVGNQIQRINAEKYLSMKDITGCPFDNQCNVEALESNFPFKHILKGPVRKGKLMDAPLEAEVGKKLELLFEGRPLYVSPRIDKYGVCEVNGLRFDSVMNRTERSSYAMCFCAEERNPKPRKFYCKMQFFFIVHVTLEENQQLELPFAFVDWYRPMSEDKKSRLERVRKLFYKEDHLVGVHRLAQRVVIYQHDSFNYILSLPL
eukprot:Seg1595.2 transcript_id=Seg1595.2/GoldUCD/mRNA.D3Y31 product="hypothetical protein" protein_id=Seg1595.2/GoldUCD/D3Y31